MCFQPKTKHVCSTFLAFFEIFSFNRIEFALESRCKTDFKAQTVKNGNIFFLLCVTPLNVYKNGVNSIAKTVKGGEKNSC